MTLLHKLAYAQYNIADSSTVNLQLEGMQSSVIKVDGINFYSHYITIANCNHNISFNVVYSVQFKEQDQ